MELKQQEYILAIEKYGNMTEAAKQLFITPSALNQQLLKLETELKIPLFTRSRHKMVPTEAGRIYLEAASKMVRLKQVTYSYLQDLAGQQTGTYNIGLTLEHGTDMFSRIYPLFHKKYPEISIHCHQQLVTDMLEGLQRGELDLAFIMVSNPNIYNTPYIPLSAENLVVGLPINHPLAALAPENTDELTTIDLNLLRNDEFATSQSNSTMRLELIDVMFENAGWQPKIIMESSFNAFLEQLTSLGMCDCIIPQSRIRNRKDVAWFYLPGHQRFQFGVAHQKGYRISTAMQEFIELARDDALKHIDFPPAAY